MSKVAFYIDGFNFYFGIKRAFEGSEGTKWGCAYWIDMVKFCESFLSEGQELVKVVYFTASPLNEEKSVLQGAFLNANKALNGDRFEVVRGEFLVNEFDCPLCGRPIRKPEEKKTDVNISVRMIGDCVQKKVDSLALISADTDLVPPLEFISNNFPDMKIKIYFPPSSDSRGIRDFVYMKNNVKLKELAKNIDRFHRSKMPDAVDTFTIPDKWRRRHAAAEAYFGKPKIKV